MKTKFLLPNKFKKTGWILMGVSLVVLLLNIFYGDIEIFTEVPILAVYNYDSFSPANSGFSVQIVDDIQFEIFSLTGLTGCVMVAFSRLKEEDELTQKIRLNSLVWATYLHFGIIIVASFSIFGSAYLNVLVLNMFTLILAFIIKFHLALYKINKD
jgi:hypothetical protein